MRYLAALMLFLMFSLFAILCGILAVQSVAAGPNMAPFALPMGLADLLCTAGAIFAPFDVLSRPF